MEDKKINERMSTFKGTSIYRNGEIEEYASKLRKEKKQNIIRGKRMKLMDATSEPQTKVLMDTLVVNFPTLLGKSKIETLKELDIILKNEFHSNDAMINEVILMKIRTLISDGNADIFQWVQSSEIINSISRILKNMKEADGVIHEAIWIVINLTASFSECTLFFIELKVQDQLVEFFNKGSPRVKLQSLWALSNMIGDSGTLREELVNSTFIPSIVRCFNETELTLSRVRILSWTISNLVRGVRDEYFSKIFPLIEYMMKFVYVQDLEVIVNGLWGLSYITEGDTHKTAVIGKLNLSSIVELLIHKELEVVQPALRIIGNICMGKPDEVEKVLNADCLIGIIDILENKNKTQLVREACWVISNIAAGPSTHIEQLIITGLMCYIEFSLKKRFI